MDRLPPVVGVVQRADLLVLQTLADLKGHENSVESVGFCHSYALALAINIPTRHH